MVLWRRLRNLERAAEAELIVILQLDGTVARFPQSAGEDAFMNLMDRLGTGDAAPPEHPLIAAVRDSSEPEWSESFYAAGEAWTTPIEDLSE